MNNDNGDLSQAELREQLDASRKAFADLGRVAIGDVVDTPEIGRTWADWHDFVIVKAREGYEKFELLAGEFFDAEGMAARIIELEADLHQAYTDNASLLTRAEAAEQIAGLEGQRDALEPVLCDRCDFEVTETDTE